MADRAQWRMVEIELHRDERGALVSLEAGRNLPFQPKRVFFLFDVPADATRGGHTATGQQLLVAVQGSCMVRLGQGPGGGHVELRSPTQALHVPAGEWLQLHDFSKGTVIAVLADELYRPR